MAYPRAISIAVILCVGSACRDTDEPAQHDTGGESTTMVTTIVPDDDGDDADSAPDDTGAETSAGDDAADTTADDDTGEPPEPDMCERFDELVAALPDAADDAERTALTDAFFADALASAHGLPIRCEGRLVVALVDEGGGSLSVTGDFDAWDPAAHPLAQPVEGFPLFVADVAVEEPLAPGLYKFVRDGKTREGVPEFFADPRARRYGWDEFGEYSLTDARVDAGHHERWPDFSVAVGDLEPRDVVVYVPAGALDETELPVLYMHDGQNLFAPDAAFGGWRVGAAIDAAIAAGDVPPMLVVGIDNTPARMDEYSHVEDDLGGGPIGGRADEYGDFLVDGVKPFVDTRYPTTVDAAGTAVMGSSMGGLVSVWLAWRYPEVFGAALSMSGTLDWGRMGLDNDRVLELYAGTPPQGAWIYLDSGGGGPCPGGDDNYCVTVEMLDLLVDLGWTEGDDVVWRHVQGAAHDEAAWADRLPTALADLGEWLGER
jgi:enterochelin esterase-like enzyme